MKQERTIMQGLASFVVRRHKLVLIAGVVLLLLSIVASQNIQVKTQIKDLLPENNPKVHSYEEINKEFGGGTTIMITIEGRDKQEMVQCAEAFVQGVRDNEKLMEYVRAINLKIDKKFMRDWGLMFQKAGDLKRTKEMLSELNLLPFITSLNDNFEREYTGTEAEEELSTSRQENEAVSMLNQLESFFVLLRDYLENPEGIPLKVQGEKLADTFLYGDQYGFNYDNTMLMFTISPNVSVVAMEKITILMDEVKKIRTSIQKQFPHLEVGYTGDVAVQSDEMAAVGFDMVFPALIALVVILVLFLFSLNQIRFIVFLLFSLVMGIVFNYGFVGISIKEINMLTSMMAVLLIGLGVDYGIQMVSNFTTFRQDGYSPEEALINTYTKAGMGVVLAALTTAIAFFVMAATGSVAFSQFGIMLGTGIIMCLIAMILILPSLLLWFGRKDITRSKLPTAEFRFVTKLGKLTYRHKWIALGISLAVTAGLFLSAVKLNRFETDFMQLEPQHMPSIVNYKKIMEKYDISPFHSMVIAENIEEARKLTNKLEEEPMVAEINSIAYFIPAEEEQKARLALIEEIRNMPKRYTNYDYSVEDVEAFAGEVQRLEWNIIEMGDLSVAGLGENNKIVKKRNRMIREIFGAETGKPGKEVFQKLISLVESDPQLYAKRLSRLDAYFVQAMDRNVNAMTQVNRKITVADLPESITKGLMAENGERNLVLIYPQKGIFDDLQSTMHFNEALEEIAPGITGSTQILVTWLEEINQTLWKAALFIFGTVILFLLLNFRSILYTIFASVPLLVGLIWMMGVYPLVGFKLNFFNVLMIPLIIGMGIDFGIHIAHRFRTEGNIETTYRYTGKAVFLSALTTMIGFGSLGLIASFPSIASMGVILFFGIASTLLTTLIILPALFGLLKKPGDKDSQGEKK